VRQRSSRSRSAHWRERFYRRPAFTSPQASDQHRRGQAGASAGYRSRVYPMPWASRPLRPELAAPLGVWPSPQLTRCAGGRAGWWLSGDVAVRCCCTAPAASAKTPAAVLAGRRSAFRPDTQRLCSAASWNLPRDRPHLSGDGPVPRPGLLPGPWLLARVLPEAQCQGWPKVISGGNAKRPRY
jgi:hypothetical protein